MLFMLIMSTGVASPGVGEKLYIMKTQQFWGLGSCFRHISLNCALGLGIMGLVAATPVALQAQTDDFSDGNDTLNPAWTHLTGYVGSSGQTYTLLGGTYRIQAPNNGLSGYGFAASYTGSSVSDVRVSADFVSFGGPGANPVFGVAARLNGNNSPLQLTGYGYAYEPFSSSLTGEMVLYRIAAGSLVQDIGSQQVSLNPSKQYTFVLEASGSTIHGQVFEVGTGTLVAEKIATDSTYTSGFSGVFGYGANGVTPPTDFTVDNFASVVPEPSTFVLMGLGALGLIIRNRFIGQRR